MGIARSVYEKTKVGHTEGIRPTDTDLERFQVVVRELEELEGQGLVEILERHKESQTGKGLIDFVRFKRLK